MQSPYDVVKRRRLTEKTAMLESLKSATSNKSVSRCENPKYTFDVDPNAKKPEIAEAIEEIYVEQNVKVVKINTIFVKSKRKNKRGKMNPGTMSRYKKAIVTLAVGNQLD